MAAIACFELLAVDLPFRKPFKHAAAERTSSSSLFLKCTTDTGATGFGESLPRDYVTGESRESAFAMLRDVILPRLIGQRFGSVEEVEAFLRQCDGQSPGWVSPDTPQTAAWCAVDLALLDALARRLAAERRAVCHRPCPEAFGTAGCCLQTRGCVSSSRP